MYSTEPYVEPVNAADALPEGVRLPQADVRTWLNERARRGWTESSRRIGRGFLLFLGDSVAGVLAVHTTLSTWELVSAGGKRPLPDVVPLLAMVFCLLPLALRVTGAYGGGRSRSDLSKIAIGVVVAAFLGWVQAQLFGRETPDLPNKAAYVYSAALITIFIWFFRLAIDRMISSAYDAGVLQRRVLVVSSATEAESLNDQCTRMPGADLRIVGRIAPDVVTDRQPALGRVPFVGSIWDLDEAFATTQADAVIVAANVPFALLEDVVTRCFRLGASVSVLPQALKRLSGTQIQVRHTALGSFLQLQPVRLDLPQMAIKRAMDVVLTLAGLAVIWPLFILIAIAIKLDSKGPVFFKQVRVGVGGRKFEIFKFRTMVVDAEAQKAKLLHLNQYGDPRLFKIKNDPRITRLGRFLRRSSLDELPQLWNVLRGDMSLVGPRPCVPDEMATYAPHHMERLFVVPGVTGPWQVNGRNSITDFEQVVRLDQEYIRSWSITSDLVILARTIPTLFRRGAY